MSLWATWYLYQPLLPGAAQIQAPVAQEAVVKRESAGGRKKRRQEDELTPEQLREIWKGGVYVPPPEPEIAAVPEQPAPRPSAPSAATMRETARAVLELRARAAEEQAIRDIQALIDEQVRARRSVAAIISAIESEIEAREDDDLSILLMAA